MHDSCFCLSFSSIYKKEFRMSLEIKPSETNLPNIISDTVKKAKIGRELLAALRAEMRVLDSTEAAEVNELRKHKLEQAQRIAEEVLDAEVVLGRYISDLETAQGQRTDTQLLRGGAIMLTKAQAIAEMGLSKDQAHRFEQLAFNQDVVEQIKKQARIAGEIISRSSVLTAIKAGRRPFVVNNSHNSEWFTPKKYIDSARKVLGNIDIDPASSEEANKIINADKYFTETDNGLQQTWTGKIWLNPPYDNVAKFVDKLVNSDIEEAIVLVNNATETGWFARLAERASAMMFHTGRLSFIREGIDGEEKSKPMQGQVFIYIGENPDTFIEEFSQYGWYTKITR